MDSFLPDAVFEAASGALILADSHGVIARVNHPLHELLGVPAGSLAGRSLLDLVRKDDRERARLLLSGTAGPVELSLLRNSGEPAQFALSAKALTVSGAPHLLISGPDVSRQRQLEGLMVQARKHESIGKLTRGVAHDFNNVLAAVMSYAELILMDSAPDDPRRADVETIRSAAQRAGELTRQILVFSRSQSVQPRPLDLNALVLSLDKLLRRVLGEDIELVTMLGDGLPPVQADPGQVEAELFAEAVAAREGLQPGDALVIETSAGDGGVLLAVRRADDADPYLMKLERAAAPPAAPGPPGTDVRGSETIIVAEDNDMVRRGITAMLSHRGFTVLPAANGEEALRLLAREPAVRLLLADVVMPGMSALDLEQRVNRLPRPAPIVFMSGYADDAVSRGVVRPAGFIQKPFTADALARKVRDVLDTYSV